jgi:hypothetical protein
VTEYHFTFSVMVSGTMSCEELERQAAAKARKLARTYHAQMRQYWRSSRKKPARDAAREEVVARQAAAEARFKEWAKDHPLPAAKPSPWSKSWWEK